VSQRRAEELRRQKAAFEAMKELCSQIGRAVWLQLEGSENRTPATVATFHEWKGRREAMIGFRDLTKAPVAPDDELVIVATFGPDEGLKTMCVDGDKPFRASLECFPRDPLEDYHVSPSKSESSGTGL